MQGASGWGSYDETNRRLQRAIVDKKIGQRSLTCCPSLGGGDN